MLFYLVIFLPIIAILLSLLLWAVFYKYSKYEEFNFAIWLLNLISSLIIASISIFLLIRAFNNNNIDNIMLYKWFSSGNVIVNIGFIFDTLTITMTSLVSTVSLLVLFYSLYYFRKYPGLARFSIYMTLFSFSMIWLILSDNLIQMFIGWELVSLCSFLLISFWHTKQSAIKAGSKSFLINRFADIFFILGIFSIMTLFHSTSFSVINDNVLQVNNLTFLLFGKEIYYVSLVAMFFIIAAFAKSVQFGLHIWLPDAMEAPTPVSALLHSATMVTSGIFLLIKLSFILSLTVDARMLIIFVSSITLVYAAIVATTQNDIKKIIAYSTISQISYMFLAVGLEYYTLAMFHLITHAFFKSLLFLGSGAVIYAMDGEQDIRKMGGLAGKIPMVYLTMLVGFLALMGMPWLSGYYSKDIIIEALYLNSSNLFMYKMAYVASIVGIFFTVMYSYKILFRVFHGTPYEVRFKLKNSPPYGMIIVLVILSFFSIFIGYLVKDFFIGNYISLFWNNSFHFNYNLYDTFKEFDISGLPKYMPTIMIVVAIIVSYLYFVKKLSMQKVTIIRVLKNLFYNNLYLDYIYTNLLNKMIYKISCIVYYFNGLLEFKIINTIPRLFNYIAKKIYRLQNGSINFYAYAIVFGIALLLGIFLIYF